MSINVYSRSVNRSRRKSCEACAESKIKCNLQYPCAKCTSRGRECVFQNDPEESRNKSLSTKGGSRKPTTAPKPLAAVSPPTSPLSASPTIQPAVPPSSDCPDTCESSRASSASPTSHLLRLPELSDSPASSESSSFHSSPRSDDFPTFDEPFDFPFDVGLYQ
ncbi:hypothetical protein B0H10DRAFT_125309 [Mycena sp. CBHHK59/15]|nr:hypothetical protein B0H10DRAFT_125309 [Mycena sp. CBHHK59/15]